MESSSNLARLLGKCLAWEDVVQQRGEVNMHVIDFLAGGRIM